MLAKTSKYHKTTKTDQVHWSTVDLKENNVLKVLERAPCISIERILQKVKYFEKYKSYRN